MEDLLPNTLCEYLYNLSGSFTTFYTNCQVSTKHRTALSGAFLTSRFFGFNAP